MGDPRTRLKKKYEKPKQRWQKLRIDKEADLIKKYGFVNKREIWKMQSILRKWRQQARKLIASKGDQARIEKEQLISKLSKLGLVKKDAKLDDVLGLEINNLCDRRLQTIVFNKGLANSIKQARQFIVHGHISIKDKKIKSPNYLVPIDEEGLVMFSKGSKIAQEQLKKSGEKVGA
ncbi:MAG: 30S ribosomal protein S4 [Candidatus Parvarchaeota archaeon]|nr:30S ribosomal protein S4 [Candidatus Jingweiarchaeum tengchongense]MCW1298145.1 30S ribosomal protein S4 [Candidatus Jingweiarchaeum tengchongense]MCW1299944.1 30S ribosomal protein S4 [Candidatus Jingweiarchaeum tengchongense]MCW1305071.1 30S ribosomal protein S4 [Candidatus Jingweiarchaeum tengchongense]MCW1305566.1 30S ribosomal protein S4 [Candidatus Jingweiarchaeum tengchongense]